MSRAGEESKPEQLGLPKNSFNYQEEDYEDASAKGECTNNYSAIT